MVGQGQITPQDPAGRVAGRGGSTVPDFAGEDDDEDAAEG